MNEYHQVFVHCRSLSIADGRRPGDLARDFFPKPSCQSEVADVGYITVSAVG